MLRRFKANGSSGLAASPPLRAICVCARKVAGSIFAARKLSWLGFVVLVPGLLHAATFTATLDRETVTVGESATLTLKFEGGQPKAIPAPPNLPNLQITSGGVANSFSIFNGKVSASVSQDFSLTPTQPGEFIIPALNAEVNGQILATQPLKLTAVKGSATTADKSGEQLAFLKLFVPKKEVFVGEVFAVELQVYIRDGIYNGENILRSFDEFGGTPLKAEGFSLLKTAHAQRRKIRIGNVVYNVAALVTSLSPIKTGLLTIGSIDANFTLQIPLPGQRRRDPFFDFGFGPPVEERRVVLSAEPQTLTSLALPRENVPADFGGAVGSYSMSVNAGPTNIAVGDPITVKVLITGRGAFDSLALPEQKAWRDFKTYPPTSKIDTTDALGLQGTKTFEQVVVPQNADVRELPAVSFSFFDPEQKTYRSLAQPAVGLIVRPAGSAPAPTVVAALPAQDNSPPAQDIVHIKQHLGAAGPIPAPLLQQPWFLAIQGVPVLAWASALIWRRRTEMLANNPRLRRQRQVAHIIREGLLELQRLAAEKKSDEFFASLFRLLQEQLGERLDLPASAITEAVIEEHLRPRGVPDAVLTPVHDLFQTCNLARYAPVKSSQELAAIIPKLQSVLGDLQALKA